MSEVSSEIFENSKLLFLNSPKESFYFKLLILFCVYLFSNYIFDRINTEDLSRAFIEKQFISINLPNNITFRLIITIIMIITSQWFYKNILKPYVNPKK